MAGIAADILTILARVGILLAVLIALTRLNGLRSFSKMSSFDIAVTVAFGSSIASALTRPDDPVWIGIAAVAGLFLWQFALSVLRLRSDRVERLVGNQPLLLMDGPEILEDNLRRAEMTVGDLYAKLREANVLDIAQVRAVVFENSGDVSVLHGAIDGPALQPGLLRDVAPGPGEGAAPGARRLSPPGGRIPCG